MKSSEKIDTLLPVILTHLGCHLSVHSYDFNELKTITYKSIVQNDFRCVMRFVRRVTIPFCENIRKTRLIDMNNIEWVGTTPIFRSVCRNLAVSVARQGWNSYVARLMLFVMIGYPFPYFDCPIITVKH